eukprot:4135253-Alexandrium_andersonii.AAC.1
MIASSWGEECVRGLMARPEVQRRVGHVCRFGTTAPAPACAGMGPVCTGTLLCQCESQPAGGVPCPRS